MRIFSLVYLLLLVYIIAALIFWGISLQKQNRQIFAQQIIILNGSVDSTSNEPEYKEHLADLNTHYQLRFKQFIGEGATFLFVILIGAVVVYTSFKGSLRLSRQQNNFMMSVTHELKSPIAAMKLSLQTLQKHQLAEDKKNELLARCIQEADRLNDLASNMLFASQLEGHKYIPTIETFDLSELVEDCVKDHASRYQRMFEEDIEVNCKFRGDKIMLQIAINNLLENAIKYTPADKPIEVELEKQSGNYVLHVKDHGPGVANDDKKKIFTKFYRAGNEETRKTKGTGLGLYLTSKIIRQHKGKIIVKDNTGGGALFEVCLPKA